MESSEKKHRHTGKPFARTSFAGKSFKRKSLIKLLRYGLPYKKPLLLSFTLLLVGSVAGLYSPVIIKQFIDDYVVPGRWVEQELLWLAMSFMGLHVIAALTAWSEAILFQKVALSIVHDIRTQAFQHLFRLPLSYFDREPVGKLVSRVTNDTETIKELFVLALPQTIKGVVTVVGVMTAMFLLNSELALFCMAILPVIMACIYFYQRFSYSVFHTSRSVLSRINTRINESIQGMPVIQMLVQQKRVSEQFERVNEEYLQVQNRLVLINGLLLRPMVHFASTLALALLVAGFSGQSLSGPVEIGLLYAFISYLDRMFEPLTQVTMQMQVWQQSVVSAERVFDMLDETVDPSFLEATYESASEAVVQSPVVAQSPIKEGKIEFNRVALSYDGLNQALNGVSFTVEPGQFVALVGHTGSGKSSIVNALMRFYPYQQGEIRLDDRPLSEYSEQALRRGLGLVFQEPFVFQGTIADNIGLEQPGISEAQRRQAAESVQAAGFIERLPNGYAEVLGERGQSLSSGEKQLLSFARTMVHEPKVLIMDEATANIDSETEQAIKQALFTLRQGRTTLAIAHRLTTIEDADQILVMERGKITQRGTHQELLQLPGLYRDMYQAQRRFMEDEPVVESQTPVTA